MIVVCAVLLGIIFALMGIRRGFFSMWILLFNVSMSVYLSIILAPTVIELFPNVGSFSGRCAASLSAIALLCFVVLQFIAGTFLTGKYSVSFPVIFGDIAAAFSGFICGYLIFSFVFFVICITPLSKHHVAEKICSRETLIKTTAKPIEKVCSLVGKISLQPRNNQVDSVIDWLISPGYDMKYKPEN